MEIEITSKRENHFLKRVEVRFQVTHRNEATPKRDELRSEIAKALSAKKENVILDWARSDFGRTRTLGYAKVYNSKEDIMKTERKPILIRMGFLAAKVREKKEKKEAPAAKAPPEKAPRKEEAKPPEKAPPKEEAKPAKKEEAPKKAEGAKPAEKGKEEKAAKKPEGEKAEAKKPAKGGK